MCLCVHILLCVFRNHSRLTIQANPGPCRDTWASGTKYRHPKEEKASSSWRRCKNNKSFPSFLGCGAEQSGWDLIRLLWASFMAWADSFSIPRHSALHETLSLRWLLPDNLIEAAITIPSLQDCDLLRLGLGVFYWLFCRLLRDTASPGSAIHVMFIVLVSLCKCPTNLLFSFSVAILIIKKDYLNDHTGISICLFWTYSANSLLKLASTKSIICLDAHSNTFHCCLKKYIQELLRCLFIRWNATACVSVFSLPV